MRVLVTGGVGYIGSHTCVELLEAGHNVFVVDNLSNGHEEVLERIRKITNCDLGFINADILDTDALGHIFKNFKPDSVIHFAGLKAVGESVIDPMKYYEVNVGGTISLLTAMSQAKCNNIIFSSSATVYGDPQYLPYDELHPTKPVNPYGRTKLIVEEMIKDWVFINKKNNGTILRYFNPVGAHPSGEIGEEPNGIPNNLMPFIAQVAVGRLDCLKIYGNTYDTHDGTGARDYIHVVDLAMAHTQTLQCQSGLKPFEIINIGCGKAVTVLELLRSFERVSGISINFEIVNCREGDLSAFWANASRAAKLIGWEPKFTIDQMCSDTWRWQNNNPKGFK
jgi:UDP-glucose 4-epimerase